MDDKFISNLINGCTIWGRYEAGIIRQIEAKYPKWINVIELDELEKILGKEFDGAKQLPYFGAILTGNGSANQDILKEEF